MFTVMIILAIITWGTLGTTGFIYWWTTEFDFLESDISMAALASLLGPISWIMGYFIHRTPTKNNNSNKILINKK